MIKCCTWVKSPQDNTKVPAGIFMKFKNGNSISIQWGFANYCSNRVETQEETLTAEIMIKDSKGHSHTFEDEHGLKEQVKGWCSADEIAKWIYFAANSQINAKSTLSPDGSNVPYVKEMGDIIDQANAKPAR
jgi:hypothetical protein